MNFRSGMLLLLLLQVLLFLCVSLTALCASGGAKKENEQSAGATEHTHTHTDVDTCEQEKYILFYVYSNFLEIPFHTNCSKSSKAVILFNEFSKQSIEHEKRVCVILAHDYT